MEPQLQESIAIRYAVARRWTTVAYVYDVVEVATARRISVDDMSHDDAVVLCERLNREAG